VESARADAARYDGNIAQDIDALSLLVGAPVDPTLLPEDFGASTIGIAALPAGLPSTVLLRRPGRAAVGIPAAFRQRGYRRGAGRVLSDHQPHRHHRFCEPGAVGPVQVRHRQLELHAAGDAAAVPGRRS
jgi:hypothetical protein